MNKVLYVIEWSVLQKLWPFFLEGLEVLNSPRGGNGCVDETRFFKTLLRVAMGDIADGAVLVLTNHKGLPLAYTILMDNTPWFGSRSALCFAIYSNHKCPTAVKQMMGEMERWCKRYGYGKLTAASRVISGAASRLFEKKWGFKKECLVFSRNV